MIFTYLNLSEIDISDRTFLFSYPEKTSFLLESIKKIGLIQPPLLYPSKEKYQIICGEGRIKALKSLNFSSIPSLIFSEPKNPKELLLISLESNLFRGLNLVEKSLFIKRALNFFSPEEILKDLLPKLGYSSHPKWFFFLEKIANLEENFKNLLILGKLNPKIIEILAELTKEDRESFLSLLNSLNLSFSEQRETLETLKDFQKRENNPELFPKEIKEIEKIEDFNLRKKLFKEFLLKIKYPNYYSKLKLLKELQKDFLKASIDLDISPYLEERKISFTFPLRNKKNLYQLEELLRTYGEKIRKLFE